MRLTLRTLLAYMDDILEPADHEDLGKKIEASDFATELIHRSRDTVRRLRLGAPAVMSDGSDDVLDTLDLSDANSVAEYLDNTLPPEQVADFERLCLEPGTKPDMHLAEVASCHHVLTMVLGEPAEVDQDLKSRMVQLPAKLVSGEKLRIEPAHGAPQAAPPVQTAPGVSAAPSILTATQPAATPVARPASTIHQELPDYLREAAAAKRKSRRWAIVTTLLAATGLTFFWFATAPEAVVPDVVAKNGLESFDGDIAIKGPDDLTPDVRTDVRTGWEDPLASAPLFVSDRSATTEIPGGGPATGVPATGGELSAAPHFVPPAPEAEGIGQPDAPSSAEAPPAEASSPIADLGVEMSDMDAALEAPVTATAPTLPEFLEAEVGPDMRVDAGVDADAEVAASVDPLRGDSPRDGPLMVEKTPSVKEETAPVDPIVVKPSGPQRLGNYLGNDDVLLIYSEAQNQWVRMPPRSPISTGDKLLTLPKFLTHVVLADVNAYLLGGTRLHIPVEKFESLTNHAELNVEMVYGRMLLNAGLKGSHVAMQVGDQLREFQLAGSASMAVEVQRVFIPGSDYENEAAPIKATWYLTSGTAQWPTAAGGTQTIETPAMWKTIDGFDEIPELVLEYPSWIDREAMTDMERSARNDVAKELKSGKPVEIQLLELTNGKGLGRRKEVRVLAAASSVYVGEFEPLVKALNDSEQKNAWDTHIHDLRQAMALSPDVAKSVRRAFGNIRGKAAAEDLMEMVVGYSDEQVGQSREAIQTGAVSQLLKWLDHESLDYRVLAIHNIREITGRWKGYRPDDSSKRRKVHLRKLWDAFESNELVPQS